MTQVMNPPNPTETISPDGKVVGPRGARAHKKWEPKKWLPIYEAIVALSCTGLDNEEVGKRFGYGKQQVSNILNTPQGKKLRELIASRVREMNIVSLEDKMAFIQNNALRNVADVIADDTGVIREKAPLALFDRSLAFLKSSGALKGDNPNSPPATHSSVTNVNQMSVMVISNEAKALLSEGMEKAKRVAEIHGNGSVQLPANTNING
jgi:hypothetical protein